MILGKIGSTNHMTKDSKANMNNFYYKDNMNKQNQFCEIEDKKNNDLTNKFTQKIINFFIIFAKILLTLIKTLILNFIFCRKSKPLFNNIQEKKNVSLIHILKLYRPKKLVKKNYRHHRIDMIAKKEDLMNKQKLIHNEDKIDNYKNNDNNCQKIRNVQYISEKSLGIYDNEKKEEMHCDIQKKKNKDIDLYYNLSKSNVNRDNMLKYTNSHLNKGNQEFIDKKNKGTKINFQKNEKKPILKYTDLQKCNNNLQFSLLSKNEKKIFKNLEIEKKNFELFVGKEKKNKKDMAIDAIKEEIYYKSMEYCLLDNAFIKIIEPSKNKPMPIDRIKILGERFNKKKANNFDNTKINENIYDENKKKTSNDNNYNYNEIIYTVNGNFCGIKSQKKESKQKRKFEEDKQKEKIEKEETRIQKIYGFRNDNNNCYLNSSLQLLTRIKELKEEVFNFNEHYEDNDTQGRLIIEFKNLLQQIEYSKDKELVLNPGRLKRVMGNVDKKYKFNNQEDSNEFISNFISALLSETGNRDKKVKKLNIVNEFEKRPYENLYKKFYQRKGDSFLFDLFYGILKVTKKCNKCNNINSIKFNVFNILELQLNNITKQNNQDLNLDQLLTNFIEEKKYEEACNNCNNDEIYSKTTIYTLPKYLIINFGRINEGKYYSNNIDYSKDLEINSEFEQENFSYVLECVIEHLGGLDGGHYTSLIPIDKNNENWDRISDSDYSLNNTGFKSRNAIILLYKLK